jgi:hypothetical protein
MLPALARPLDFDYRVMPLFQLIGLISSALGVAIILFVVRLMPVYPIGPVISPAAIRYYWGVAVIVAVILTMVRILAVRPRLLDSGITAISAALIGIVIASICSNRWRAA